MPHAVSKGLGLQAIILCGPGSSFPTFTANPDENPKALLPIANRPMVWYPLDFCYRSGITDVTLVCPPTAADTIKGALKTNPFLTSIASPAVLAPEELDYTTGTAAILRLPEIRKVVTGDFVVLPCDLVCALPGEKLLQAWMVRAELGDILGGEDDDDFEEEDTPSSIVHSGGLGVWYDTRTGPKVKGEETDFVATVPSKGAAAVKAAAASKLSKNSALQVEEVVTAMPKDALNDLVEDKESYSVRHGLLRQHRRVRMRTTHRDAHIYVFPQWVMDFVQTNEHIMDSIGEDVLGWWAKASWQKGLAEKLGADKVLQKYEQAAGEGGDEGKEGDHDHSSPSENSPVRSRHTRRVVLPAPTPEGRLIEAMAKVVGATSSEGVAVDAVAPTTTTTAPTKTEEGIPPMMAYIHPSSETAPLIRRVDTSQLLLTVSLQLAKLPSIEESHAAAAAETGDSTTAAASPFAHTRKVAYPEGVKSRTTITRQDSLVGDSVSVEEKVSIKECVIGANCQIHEGAKLHQCLLMDGVVVNKACRLTRCILGKRSEIGAGSVLTDCEVQENMLVEAKTVENNNTFMSSEGLEATAEEMDEAMQDADGEEIDLA